MVGINSTPTLSSVDTSPCGDYFKEKKPQQNNFTENIHRLNNTMTELAKNNGSSVLSKNADLPNITEPGYAYFQAGKSKQVNAQSCVSVRNMATDAEKKTISESTLTNDDLSPAEKRTNTPFTDGLEFISFAKRKEMIEDLVKEGYSEKFIKHAINRFSLKNTDFITK